MADAGAAPVGGGAGVSAVGATGVVKSGWLTKRGAWIPTWKRRWCVLKANGELTYFTNAVDARDNKEQKGCVDVAGATVDVLDDVTAARKYDRAHCIEVTSPKRKFVMSCDTGRDIPDWCRAFVAAGATLAPTPSLPPPLPGAGADVPVAAAAAPAVAVAPAPAAPPTAAVTAASPSNAGAAVPVAAPGSGSGVKPAREASVNAIPLPKGAAPPIPAKKFGPGGYRPSGTLPREFAAAMAASIGVTPQFGPPGTATASPPPAAPGTLPVGAFVAPGGTTPTTTAATSSDAKKPFAAIGEADAEPGTASAAPVPSPPPPAPRSAAVAGSSDALDPDDIEDGAPAPPALPPRPPTGAASPPTSNSGKRKDKPASDPSGAVAAVEPVPTPAPAPAPASMSADKPAPNTTNSSAAPNRSGTNVLIAKAGPSASVVVTAAAAAADVKAKSHSPPSVAASSPATPARALSPPLPPLPGGGAAKQPAASPATTPPTPAPRTLVAATDSGSGGGGGGGGGGAVARAIAAANATATAAATAPPKPVPGALKRPSTFTPAASPTAASAAASSSRATAPALASADAKTAKQPAAPALAAAPATPTAGAGAAKPATPTAKAAAPALGKAASGDTQPGRAAAAIGLSPTAGDAKQSHVPPTAAATATAGPAMATASSTGGNSSSPVPGAGGEAGALSPLPLPPVTSPTTARVPPPATAATLPPAAAPLPAAVATTPAPAVDTPAPTDEQLLQSDAALHTLLSAPAGDAKVAEFVAFCKSIFAEENVLFALEIFRYKATHSGGWTTAELMRYDAAACAALFLAPHSAHEVSLPRQLKADIDAALSGRGGSAAPVLSAQLFDAALRHIIAAIRTETVPKYVAYKQQQKQAGAAAASPVAAGKLPSHATPTAGGDAKEAAAPMTARGVVVAKPVPPPISRTNKPQLQMGPHQKAAAAIAAANKAAADAAAAAAAAADAPESGPGGMGLGLGVAGVGLNRKVSPLTKAEEQTLAQWLPLTAHCDTDSLDAFFAFVRGGLSRDKWHFVLETHVALAASVHKPVATQLYARWATWLFPLMQRQTDKQLLMDKESEQQLLSLVTLLISQVHFRRFALDGTGADADGNGVTPGDGSAGGGGGTRSDRERAEKEGKDGGSGGGGDKDDPLSGTFTSLQRLMDKIAASDRNKGGAAGGAGGGGGGGAGGSGGDEDIGASLQALVNLIAEFCWNDGTVRVVRMILAAFLNLVLTAAKTDRAWRNSVTHPSWKNLLSVLSVLEEFVFCRPLNAKKMGVHLFGKGCLDLRLVTLAKTILDALPIHTLDAVPDPNPHVAKLQQRTQAMMIDERAFWGAAQLYCQAVGRVADVLPTTLVVDAKAKSALDAANAQLSAAQQALQAIMSTRKRFSSFWGSGKVKPELLEMFADVLTELRHRKNSKFMQPAVQYAALQDATHAPGNVAGQSGTGGGGAGGHAAGSSSARSARQRPSEAPELFEEDDELTSADVHKLMEQCTGAPVSLGSFGRVYRVQLFAQWWACKVLNAERVSRQAIRSEIRVHRKLRARRCVMFRGCHTKGNPIVILSEWGGTDLHQFIHPPPRAVAAAAIAASALPPPTTAPGTPTHAALTNSGGRASPRDAGANEPKAAAGGGAGAALAPVKEQETVGAAPAIVTTAPQDAAGSGGGESKQPQLSVSVSVSPSTSPQPSLLSHSGASSSSGPSSAAVTPSAAVAPMAATVVVATAPVTPPSSNNPHAAATLQLPGAGAAAAAASGRGARPSGSAPAVVLTDLLRAKITYQIAEGLNELHHQQPPVVHRDLKPSNVLMDKNLDVKLCDFGFSHAVNSSSLGGGGGGGGGAASESSMKVGNKAGTPLYKAPETWDPELTIDVASDVYSLGIVLHELWCPAGRLPWADKTYEQLVALHLIKRAPPPIDPALTAAHPKIAAVIEWCTRPDRRQRPKAEQVMERLQGVLPAYGLELD